MNKIAVIAVNEHCEEREDRLKEYIAQKMVTHLDFEVINFADLAIDEMVNKAKEEADRTIIVFDAVRGMNTRFSYAATKLFENEIHPILLISNSDNKNADISSANTSLAEIWSFEDPSLESWDLNFHNLYFSYETMGIDTSPEVKNDNIDALIKLIS